MKIGNVSKFKATRGACNRTKNRLREHGEAGFFVKSFSPCSSLFGGEPAVLLKSVTCNASDGAGGKENWQGWLPIPEIEEIS